VNLREYLELQSDEEDLELKKRMSRMTGGKIKQYKKEKSLGILCQQFIHLFVTWKTTLSLEEAAKMISISERPEKQESNQKLKTKIRRLYDIANVLQSIGLIEKCHISMTSKKPAFKWTGLQSTINFVHELKQQSLIFNMSKQNSRYSGQI